MPDSMTLRDALDEAATGDVWLFRGRSAADRAIRLFTNSPVNHVGIVLAIDDLPPLIWHAELGASMPNVWTGERERGAQLHLLERAVSVWTHRYGQDPWFRQIDIEVSDDMENQALAVVAEYSGRGFPSPASLAKHWLTGRVRKQISLTDVYCAELAAITYERMGLLGGERPPNWYDPGTFWSGDRLELVGASLGPEIHVTDVTPLDDAWRDG
ncbi:MAG: hypothetical protein WBL31_08095 [Ilumatobacteraceae bacterium]|jgi:hypothetical protein